MDTNGTVGNSLSVRSSTGHQDHLRVPSLGKEKDVSTFQSGVQRFFCKHAMLPSHVALFYGMLGYKEGNTPCKASNVSLEMASHLSEPAGQQEAAPQDNTHTALVTASPVSLVLVPSPLVLADQSFRFRRHVIFVLLVGMVVLGSLATVLTTLLPLSGQVTLTIYPQRQVERVNLRLSGIQVGDHQISSASAPHSATGAATGSASVAAQFAQGEVSFFNLAPYPQTVPAATVLTATNGVQVRILAAAHMPASVGAKEGMAVVPAQALQTGASGNLPVDAINQSCCAPGIWAKNTTPFSGGQDAQSYTYVLQRDIDHLTTALVGQATREAQVILESEVRPAEQQVEGSGSCSPTVSADHPANSRAALVTVSVQVTCKAEVFQPGRARTIAHNALIEQSRKALGPSYTLSGTVTFALQAAETSRGLLCTVQASGTWLYHVQRQDILRLLARFTGRSVQQAKLALEHLAGIARVEASGSSTMPDDLHQVTLLFQS